MGVAEELGRLVELRDKGVLTEREFAQKKKQILKGNSPWWRTALMWVIGIWAGVCLLSILVAIFVPAIRNWMAADNGLSCDSPEVKETATNVLNQQVTNLKNQFGVFGELAMPGTQFHGIGDTEELYRDKDSGFIACLGTVRGTKGEDQIAYTVSWQDRAIGKFWVELANPAQLRKQYSGELNETAEVAPAPPKSPREELLDVLAEMKKSTPPEESEPADQPPSEEEIKAAEDARSLEFHQRQGTPTVHGQIVATVEVSRHGTITLTDTQNSSVNNMCSQTQRDGVKTAGIESAPGRVCWSPDNGDIVVNAAGRTFRLPASEFQPAPDYVERVRSEDGRAWYERLPASPVQGNVVATYMHESLGKLMLTDTSCQAAGRQFKVQSLGSQYHPPSFGCWSEDQEVVSGFLRTVGGGTTRFKFASADVEMVKK